MAYARGVDISHHQGVYDWGNAKFRYDLTFGIVKATEGQGWRDVQFKRNWTQMKNNGLVRGAYHFARPGGDVGLNVSNFLTAIKEAGGLERSDLVVLDLEVTDNLSSAAIGAWAREWCARVADDTGRPPLVYTFYGFIEGGDRPKRVDGLGAYPLWIAYWPDRSAWWPVDQKPPRIPQPWGSAGADWFMWQHTDSNNVLDLNVFNGTPQQLRAYADNQDGRITPGGGDGMLPCKLGDKGEAVEYWQRVLAQLNYYKGEYDGVYGTATKAAIDAARKDLGLGADTRVSPYLAMKLHQALFSTPGPKGDRGPGPTDAQVANAATAWLAAHIDVLRGEDGRSLTPAEIGAAVSAWASVPANRELIRGPKGDDGKTPTKIAVHLTGDVIESE